MKMKDLIFSLSVLIFVSCTSNDPLRSEDGVTVISLLDVNEEDNDYAIQKIAPLETTSDNLMGMYLRVKIAGDELFVLDEDIKDAVHRFDVSGKYKGAVAQSGEGPGMVNNMYDFLIDGDTLEVLTGKGSHSENRQGFLNRWRLKAPATRPDRRFLRKAGQWKLHHLCWIQFTPCHPPSSRA